VTGPVGVADGGYGALRSGAGARVVARDVVQVSGPDAASYLQGQCSQDLDSLTVGLATEALLLSPQGKVDAWVRITRTGDETFVLDADPGCGPAAQARLERFKLRTKVTIESLDWTCLSVRGPAARPGDDASAELVVAVDTPGWSGVDLLGPAPTDDPDLRTWAPVDVVWCDEEAWEAARIEAGVPTGGREVTESTIPAEADLVERTVSFTKGCFTGQELVARLDARGSNVARHLCGVVVSGAAAPPVGAAVWTADGAREAGSLSSVAWSPGLTSYVALATLHRRVSPPEPVVVRWDADDADDAHGAHEVAGEARPLPLVPAD
jgi:tRNA-modifying protein YgfZ